MKSAIVLCLLAALCTINGIPISSDLEILKIQIRNMKWSIDNNVQQIHRLRKETEENTDLQITENLWQQMDSRREYTDLLLNVLNNKVNEAKAAGKDPDTCHTTAINGIKTNTDSAYDESNKCKQNAATSITKSLSFIDNLIATAFALIMELDNVIINCHSSDSFQMQTCVISELAKINNDIKILESDTSSAEATTLPISNNIILQATSCIRNAYTSMYSKDSAILLDANNCIKLLKV